MKINRFLTLILFLTAFSFTCFCQVEDEEVQFAIEGQPKLTRAISKPALDFGVLKKESKTLRIEITNSSKSDCKIACTSIPEGVWVLVVKEVLKPGEKGEIAIMVDPGYVKSGSFKKGIVISATTQKNGKASTKVQEYDIKGQVL